MQFGIDSGCSSLPPIIFLLRVLLVVLSPFGLQWVFPVTSVAWSLQRILDRQERSLSRLLPLSASLISQRSWGATRPCRTTVVCATGGTGHVNVLILDGSCSQTTRYSCKANGRVILLFLYVLFCLSCFVFVVFGFLLFTTHYSRSLGRVLFRGPGAPREWTGWTWQGRLVVGHFCKGRGWGGPVGRLRGHGGLWDRVPESWGGWPDLLEGTIRSHNLRSTNNCDSTVEGVRGPERSGPRQVGKEEKWDLRRRWRKSLFRKTSVLTRSTTNFFSGDPRPRFETVLSLYGVFVRSCWQTDSGNV